MSEWCPKIQGECDTPDECLDCSHGVQVSELDGFNEIAAFVGATGALDDYVPDPSDVRE